VAVRLTNFRPPPEDKGNRLRVFSIFWADPVGGGSPKTVELSDLDNKHRGYIVVVGYI
jgi:hypothetical protein